MRRCRLAVLTEPETVEDARRVADMASQLLFLNDLSEATGLIGGWSASWPAISDDSSIDICNVGAFADQFGGADVVGVMSGRGPDRQLQIFHVIVAFLSDESARDAMDYLRNTVSCEEFDDPGGNTWWVEPQSPREFGDESFSVLAGIDLGEQRGTGGARVHPCRRSNRYSALSRDGRVAWATRICGGC
jgi:hypothetical protein